MRLAASVGRVFGFATIVSAPAIIKPRERSIDAGETSGVGRKRPPVTGKLRRGGLLVWDQTGRNSQDNRIQRVATVEQLTWSRRSAVAAAKNRIEDVEQTKRGSHDDSWDRPGGPSRSKDLRLQHCQYSGQCEIRGTRSGCSYSGIPHGSWDTAAARWPRDRIARRAAVAAAGTGGAGLGQRADQLRTIELSAACYSSTSLDRYIPSPCLGTGTANRSPCRSPSDSLTDLGVRRRRRRVHIRGVHQTER